MAWIREHKLWVIGLVTFVLLALANLGGCYVWSSGQVRILLDHYPKLVWSISEEKLEVKFQESSPPTWVSLDDTSDLAICAVLVSEDWAFYQHSGFDMRQIKESIKKNWKQKRYARGASTISQQVVRNLFLHKKKTLRRKFRELMLAIALERSLSKNRILEVYLNIAHWGEGIYGIAGAAAHYFEKDATTLNAKEGAFLAMLLPSPRVYAESFNNAELTEFARSSVEAILSKMQRAGCVQEDDVDFYNQMPLSFEVREDDFLPREEAAHLEAEKDNAEKEVTLSTESAREHP